MVQNHTYFACVKRCKYVTSLWNGFASLTLAYIVHSLWFSSNYVALLSIEQINSACLDTYY